MSTYKNGTNVRYYVTTDTHGSPWGIRNGVNGKTIHFDLGDNTIGYRRGDFDAPEQMSVAATIALYGNHDTVVNGYKLKGLQTYRDTSNQIIVFGLDTGTDTISHFEIPVEEIDEMAATLASLQGSWDVIILTHVPLFPGKKTTIPQWDCGKCWELPQKDDNVEPYAGVYRLLNLLKAFRGHKYSDTYTTSKGTTYRFTSTNGYVIGCFAGHIHNHVKCVYRSVPMETFPTNGSNEWTKGGEYQNGGLYVPGESYINVNYAAMSVNGMPFDVPQEGYFKPYDTYHNESNCTYMNQAAGYFKFYPDTTAYPKFYSGAYLGYSASPLDGISFGKNTCDDRYWPFNADMNVTITAAGKSTTVSTRAIWFDANGRLRYYATKTPVSSHNSYKEIEGYRSARITFTANNVRWTFQNGLLESAVPVFRSGSFVGKNGYGIAFGSDGVPTGITLNGGAPKDYGAGQNFINVTNVRIYAGTALKEITTTPQIGTTTTFAGAKKLDLARSTSAGANQITSPDTQLVRVVGNNNTVIWLYGGKLTALTDAQVL